MSILINASVVSNNCLESSGIFYMPPPQTALTNSAEKNNTYVSFLGFFVLYKKNSVIFLYGLPKAGSPLLFRILTPIPIPNAHAKINCVLLSFKSSIMNLNPLIPIIANKITKTPPKTAVGMAQLIKIKQKKQMSLLILKLYGMEKK